MDAAALAMGNAVLPHRPKTRIAAMKLMLTLKQLNGGELFSIAAVMFMVVAVAYGLLA
jgi:hypothetical protein